MSQQGPILVVSTAERPSFASALDEAKLFPLVETEWRDAAHAVEQVQPAAVIAAASGASDPIACRSCGPCRTGRRPRALSSADRGRSRHRTARQRHSVPSKPGQSRAPAGATQRRPARPLLACDRDAPACLRPRRYALSDIDTCRDATVLLIGRGGAYPALSVALGERTGVVGALWIEAAAKHLNARDIDGIVLGEGFSPRVMDAFLTVLTEDARFRNLPVVVDVGPIGRPITICRTSRSCPAEPAQIAATALPMIRQHAFEAHLSRTLRAIDADGLIDARTGLLTNAAFDRDFATAVYQTLERGGGLSVARFAFDPGASARPVRRRADHQPPDAADGFRRRAGRRIGHRRLRRDRFAQRAHDRAAAVERDAAHQPRQARGPRRARRDGRDVAAERFGEVAAGAALTQKRIARRRNCS